MPKKTRSKTSCIALVYRTGSLEARFMLREVFVCLASAKFFLTLNLFESMKVFQALKEIKNQKPKECHCYLVKTKSLKSFNVEAKLNKS